MSADTTTIPVPPYPWHTSFDVERIAAQRSTAAGPFANVAVDVDPDEARRTCEQIQAGSRRAEREEWVNNLLGIARLLASAAALSPDDTLGRWPSAIRPGVPPVSRG